MQSKFIVRTIFAAALLVACAWLADSVLVSAQQLGGGGINNGAGGGSLAGVCPPAVSGQVLYDNNGACASTATLSLSGVTLTVAAGSAGLVSFNGDTGISRTAAGTVGVGTGAQGSTAGTLLAQTIQSTTGSIVAGLNLVVDAILSGGATSSTLNSNGGSLNLQVSSSTVGIMASGGFALGGATTFGSTTAATSTTGELAGLKISASGTAPGANYAKFEWVCGTNAGSMKLISYAGTSTTPVTIIDNVGSGGTGC